MKRLLPLFLLLSLCCLPAQAQWGTMIPGACRQPGMPCPQGTSGISIPNYTPNAGLPNWQACRAQVKAGTGSCNIAVWGDSDSSALGSFFGSSDPHSGAWPNQLKALMQLPAAGIIFNTNTLTGDSAAVSFTSFDTRVSSLGGWTPFSSAFVFGHNAWLNNDTTAFTFNPSDKTTYPSAPTLLTDSLDIYWFGNFGGTGNITVDIGGAAICTINVAGAAANSFNKTTCSTTLGNNTYNIKCSNAVAANCVFFALNAYNSATKSVTVFNGASQGALMAQMAGSTPASYDPVASMSVYLPKLCIIMGVGNDANAQTSITSYTTSLTTIVNGCKAVGADVLLVTGFPYGITTSPLTVPQYQAAILAVATSANVPVWDSLAALGGGATTAPWAALIANGWNADCCGNPNDNTHWSVGGYTWFATNIQNILIQ